MNLSRRLLILTIPGLLLLFSLTTPAQWDKKPYTEWSEKDAQKLLNDSPWAKTQTFVTSTEATGSGTRTSNANREILTNSFQINFRIRLFSAKPIRQAHSRTMELSQKGNINEQMAAQLKAFANGDFNEYVIVTVTCDSEQRGNPLQEATMLLQGHTTAKLQSNTYLEVKGQKVYLKEYQSPR